MLTLIRTVTLIHLLAVISPGPDFVVAVKNSLTYGRKTGIWTAIGIGLGIGVHLIYCMAGLALLISQSILLFSIIKFIGAGYLIYIGVSSILAKSSKIEVVADELKPAMSPMQAVWNGFLTNVLNPKATMFFLSLFTLVISPDTSISLMILLGVIMIVNT
ncbi:LysE family translocator, partial [Patescibacteria group bacterium]|nr:LysE family translocator [Patescibacteria group bacterium]